MGGGGDGAVSGVMTGALGMHASGPLTSGTMETNSVLA